MVATLKLSIQYPSLPFTPLCSPSLPFAPLCSLHLTLLPSFPFTPLHSPLLWGHLTTTCWDQTFWWLIRVTLGVDWLFLPKTFGLVVGTYKGLLPLFECRWGSGSICRWWGHLTTACWNQAFLFQVVGTFKTSIQYPSLPLCPVCSPSPPLHVVGTPNYYMLKSNFFHCRWWGP